MHTLVPHPAFPPRAVTGVAVELVAGAEGWTLSYRVTGGPVSWSEPAPPERTDGLWRSTCFELFVRTAGDASYREFNFAPSGQWAAYRFSGRRAGTTDLAMPAPDIVASEQMLSLTLARDALPNGPVAVNLTAVIEEADGTKSYWALAHPDGPPDFHDPACFVLELPAPN